MNKVELESFIKSFILFFVSLTTLMGFLFYLNYTKQVQNLNEMIFSQMRVCSYNLKCKNLKLEFIEKADQELYKLNILNNELYSYYPIPNSQKYIMSLKLEKKEYTYKIEQIKKDGMWEFLVIVIIILLLSVLFSFYALNPLRNALLLTQEFVKDILHDFNTPLASLRLNTDMLKSELKENKKLDRIEKSVQNILNLQNHLKSYITNSSLEKEEFYLQDLLVQRVYLLEKNYPNLSFKIDSKRIKLFCNKDAFTRIIDNLLSNAAKYNKQNGFVQLRIEETKLLITDSGKGIKNPKKIFDRFYKEQARGIGIGLHIVKKLCDELHIKISLQSKVDEGTTFFLELSALTHS